VVTEQMVCVGLVGLAQDYSMGEGREEQVLRQEDMMQIFKVSHSGQVERR
jgi:hypothetical protein